MQGRLPRYVGPYAIEGQVGSGGMAVVLLARHRLLKRRVAIKIRQRTEAPEEDVLALRFRHGAELQSELEHPHIARVYDYLEAPQFQALVMEYLPGGSIEERIREAGGPLSVSEVLTVGIRMADALSASHKRGIIHRDLKPGNLMLREKGLASSVRLTDFGVAKTDDRSPELTLSGANVGTMWYMPPEQFDGQAPTPQVDVYSLGATLYEMLCNHIPFASEAHSEIFSRFLDKTAPPPIYDRNPLAPGLLVAVIDGTLELSLEKRVPSAAALSLLLRAVADREGLSLGSEVCAALLAEAGPELKTFVDGQTSDEGHELAVALDGLVTRTRDHSAGTLS